VIIPCEVTSKSVVPAVRALIAKELIERRNLKQDEVAKVLGISQSAVSKYARNVRGYAIKIDEIKEVRSLIDKMIDLLTNGTFHRDEFLRYFCQTCTTIRRKGLMCPFCQKSDPDMKMEICSFCTTYDHPDIKRE
jgi:predicted transcriptional regulator